MFCVIQKIINKKPNQYGAPKKLEVTSYSYTNNFGRQLTEYGYKYSYERFERTIKDAYKISIHKSYRENGKVKKKQWVICTMSYYNIIEYSLFDCAGSRITKLAPEIGITEDEMYDMIYKKLDPIAEKIEKEFKQTEEYKTKTKHEKIISNYRHKKDKFNKKYALFSFKESNEYDFCYDVFGVLRNPSHLESLEYSRKMKENAKSSYQSNEQSNYNNNSNYDYSSYFTNKSSTYTDDEKQMLKKIYKVASKKFHPDVSGDDGSMMKFLTKLKEQWGI